MCKTEKIIIMMVQQVKVKQLMQQMVELKEVINCLDDQKDDVGGIKGTRTTLSGLIMME